MSAGTELTTITVETPCCGEPVSLRFDPFVHAGAPRTRDQHGEAWNLRCPKCDAAWSVFFELRLRKIRREYETRFDTYSRAVGAPLWTSLELKSRRSPADS